MKPKIYKSWNEWALIYESIDSHKLKRLEFYYWTSAIDFLEMLYRLNAVKR